MIDKIERFVFFSLFAINVGAVLFAVAMLIFIFLNGGL